MDRLLSFFAGLPARLAAAGLKTRLLLALLAGWLCLCALPPWNFWPLLVMGLSLLYTLLATSTKSSFWTGYAFGLGFFLPGLLWVGNALLVDGNPYAWAYPFAVMGLPLLLSFFPALCAALAARLLPLRAGAGLIGFASLMGLVEFLRGHIFTGFPWNLFGYAWSSTLPVAQTAAAVGIYGLTFLTILWSVTPGFLMTWQASPARKALAGCLVLLSFLGCFLAGSARLASNAPALRTDIALNIVQPGIPQQDKWDPSKQVSNLKKLLDLTTPPDTGEPARITLVIWPETAVTERILLHEQVMPHAREALAAYQGQVFLVSGVLRTKEGERPRYYNSLVTYDAALNEIAAYDKAHLVPFGEYIPFQRWIPLAPVAHFSGFEAGDGPRTDEVTSGLRLAPLICYEVIFPQSARQERADVIVNVTNDAWYGDSAGPRQHFVMAQFRALEQGVPVVRAANTGISGLFDAYGRVMTDAPLDTARALQAALPTTATRATLYSRFGDTPLLLGLALALCFSFLFGKTLKKTK